MIVIGLGANLPTAEFGEPRATLGAALEAMETAGIRVIDRSPWYQSAPVPVSDDPWYVNGVVSVETRLKAEELVKTLLSMEAGFGRTRTELNAPRILDMDLIAYNNVIVSGETRDQLSIPHPRMSDRAFVVLPLKDIAPDWVHPVTGTTISELAKKLPASQKTIQMKDAPGLFGTEWHGKSNL